MSRSRVEQLLGLDEVPSERETAQPGAARVEEPRAELVEEDAEPEGYRPYISRSRPQMGFTLIERGGTMHGFMYHTVRHPKHQLRDGDEFLSFTADGLAVVMQGQGLKILFRAMIRHTLVEGREHDGKAVVDTPTRIDRLAVVDTRALTNETRELMT